MEASQHLGADGTAKPQPPAHAVLAVAPPATTSYADAVDRAAPAVVTIRVEKRTQADQDGMDGGSFFERFFGQGFGDGGQTRSQRPQTQIEQGVGSGVIVSADGRILTNDHVVDGADRVAVTLTDGREFTAKVVGTDAASDLAVVKIDATDLPALPLGNSDAVRVGDVVLAIGNPLNLGQTVTMGIISAKDRTTGVGNGSYEDFLQTDAPINRGNSGGALITARGELVGINSQILSDGMNSGNIGIGFAIPANMARNVMNQLVTSGHVRRAILGITVQSMSSDLAKSLNLSTVHGALVNTVEPSSPAGKAGVQQGDVIVKLNGQAVADSNDLRNRVSSMAPGSTATLDISRDGADRQLSVTLGDAAPAKEASADQPASTSDLGMTLEALTPSVAGQAPGSARRRGRGHLERGCVRRGGSRAGSSLATSSGRSTASPCARRRTCGRL